MSTTKTQNFILYSLGKWFEEANKKIKGKPLEVSISKVVFIELVQKSGIAQKQKRALYKNLETLEKKKLVSYQYKELALTKKGKALYQKINKEIEPFINVNKQLAGKKTTTYTKKVQTIFK